MKAIFLRSPRFAGAALFFCLAASGCNAALAQPKPGRSAAPAPAAESRCQAREVSTSAASSISPRSLPHDSRLVVFPYHHDALFPVNALFNRYTHFEFEPGEKIVASYINDETEWEMKVSATGRDVLVRPKVKGVAGSMVTITDRRRYQIDLTEVSDCPAEWRYQRVSWTHQDGSYEDPGALSQLRAPARAARPGAGIQEEPSRTPLPGMPAAPLAPSEPVRLDLATVNSAYEIDGDRDLAPSAVLDDGRRTVLKFPSRMALRPVLFAVSADGNAEAVEYVAADSHFLVNRVFEHGLQLKLGSREVRVRNRTSSCGWFDKACRRVDATNIQAN